MVKGHEVDTMLDKLKKYFVWTTLSVSLGYGLYLYDRYMTQKNHERMIIICPSLLSIGRSARDTLIVMKNEPLCNRYVLENLK